MTWGPRRLGLCALVALAGCTSAPSSTPSPVAGRPIVAPQPSAIPASVIAAARRFAGQALTRDYAGQWTGLAPAAQAMWPGEAARTAMLGAKFATAPITGITLGAAHPSHWTNPENPAVSVAHTYEIPVQVSLALPASARPSDAATTLSMLPLEVSEDPETGTALIVGEGPLSLDAPLIVPPHPAAWRVVVPILMYHLVDAIPPRKVEPSAYAWQLEVGLTVTPAQFAAEMATARAAGGISISLTHLGDALLYGLPLPRHSFVITFDDGRLSPYVNAVPVLRHYGYTAEFFVPSGFIGQTRGSQTYMSAADLQDLANSGFWVEDHTIKDNAPLWGASSPLLTALTAVSRVALEQITGRPIQFIAYTGMWPWPCATQGTTQEQGMFGSLARFGYIGGVLDQRAQSDIVLTSGLWQIPRLRVSLGTPAASVAAWLRGSPGEVRVSPTPAPSPTPTATPTALATPAGPASSPPPAPAHC